MNKLQKLMQELIRNSGFNRNIIKRIITGRKISWPIPLSEFTKLTGDELTQVLDESHSRRVNLHTQMSYVIIWNTKNQAYRLRYIGDPLPLKQGEEMDRNKSETDVKSFLSRPRPSEIVMVSAGYHLLSRSDDCTSYRVKSSDFSGNEFTLQFNKNTFDHDPPKSASPPNHPAPPENLIETQGLIDSARDSILELHQHLICPITHELIAEPTLYTDTMYELEALDQWDNILLKQGRLLTSPTTREIGAPPSTDSPICDIYTNIKKQYIKTLGLLDEITLCNIKKYRYQIPLLADRCASISNEVIKYLDDKYQQEPTVSESIYCRELLNNTKTIFSKTLAKVIKLQNMNDETFTRSQNRLDQALADAKSSGKARAPKVKITGTQARALHLRPTPPPVRPSHHHRFQRNAMAFRPTPPTAPRQPHSRRPRL